jgi:hypothetical protein
MAEELPPKSWNDNFFLLAFGLWISAREPTFIELDRSGVMLLS